MKTLFLALTAMLTLSFSPLSFSPLCVSPLCHAHSPFETTPETPTLHVILVGDTVSNIKEADKLDLAAMKGLIENVDETLEGEINVQLKSIRDRDWGGTAVIRACENLDVKSNDAIVFFYTGHGFRTSDMDAANDKWPALALDKKSDGTRDDVKLSDIYKKLAAKNPRLLIVMADCCNSYVPSEYTPATRGTFRKQFCRELFVNATGKYISCGSLMGEYGIATSMGSLYTNEFVDRVKMVLTSNEFDASTSGWDAIFGDICHQLAPSGHTQIPQFENNPSFSN